MIRMKNITDLNNDIFKVTLDIDNTYPELVKYFGEIPVTITQDNQAEVSQANLADYYNSLDLLFNDYTVYHRNPVK